MTSAAQSAPALVAGTPLSRLDVPIDERDELAVPLACWLATRWGLPVRLLHVATGSGEATVDLERTVAAAAARWPDVPIDAQLLDGGPEGDGRVADTIVGATGAAAMLIVSTDNANAWSFKNSVAERLVHQVGAPLVLIGPAATERAGAAGIVVAYDGTPASVAALVAAEALAVALGERLWLARVVPEGLGEPGRIHQDGPDPRTELEAACDGLDPATGATSAVVRSNDPVGAIEAFAAEVGARMIAAGARDRADETRTTMSSITMGLVATAARPVLVVVR